MWMGSPCCTCGDANVCESGIICINTYNIYNGSNIPMTAILGTAGSGETPVCIHYDSVSDFGGVAPKFRIEGENICANYYEYGIPPELVNGCDTFSTGVPICATRLRYNETYYDASSTSFCADNFYRIIDCEDPEISYGLITTENRTVNGSSISCPDGPFPPEGDLVFDFCYDEMTMGTGILLGKSISFQSLYSWTYNIDGSIDYYLSDCQTIDLVNCAVNDITVPRQLHHSCGEIWESEASSDTDTNPYQGCCPDPITWTDSRLADYLDFDSCGCGNYNLAASPCFKPEDFTLTFNGTLPFSGNCLDIFSVGGCNQDYLMEVEGPISLENTGTLGDHTNTWNDLLESCGGSLTPTPYNLSFQFCRSDDPYIGKTTLSVTITGRGYQPGSGLCICPELACPGFLDLAFTRSAVFSGYVNSCNPFDCDIYDDYGNIIGSVTL